MSADAYDRMDLAQLCLACVVRGKPNWRDFSAQEIRELLRADDLDRDAIAPSEDQS